MVLFALLFVKETYQQKLRNGSTLSLLRLFHEPYMLLVVVIVAQYQKAVVLIPGDCALANCSVSYDHRPLIEKPIVKLGCQRRIFLCDVYELQ
jgi:hypothetical protein